MDYITVKQQTTEEIVEKKSRFIAHVFPVSSQEEADTSLQYTKKRNHAESCGCST